MLQQNTNVLYKSVKTDCRYLLMTCYHKYKICQCNARGLSYKCFSYLLRLLAKVLIKDTLLTD